MARGFESKSVADAQEAMQAGKPVRADVVSPELVEDSRAFADESLNRLYDAIRQLSEVDRAVILLYLDEKSYREIGEIIGTNPNNVGVRISRIKDRLRRLLDEKDDRSGVA